MSENQMKKHPAFGMSGFQTSGSITSGFQMLYITRPVWTGFKIAVRPKLLTHYYKVRCLDTIIICNSWNKNYNLDIKMYTITMYQINKPKMV